MNEKKTTTTTRVPRNARKVLSADFVTSETKEVQGKKRPKSQVEEAANSKKVLQQQKKQQKASSSAPPKANV